MPKLYYKYGAMGSSKSAQALMCKFNYEQQGFEVALLKPSIDTRDVSQDGEAIVSSRIGLSSKCLTFDKNVNLCEFIYNINQFKANAIVIVDECQFCTSNQIDELKELTVDSIFYGKIQIKYITLYKN